MGSLSPKSEQKPSGSSKKIIADEQASTKPEASRTAGEYLKVLCFDQEAFSAVTNVRVPWSTTDQNERKILNDLRLSLKSYVRFHYGFCLRDGSFVPNDISMKEYLQQTTETDTKTESNSTDNAEKTSNIAGSVYIKEQTESPNTGILIQGEFILKIIDKSSETQVCGSIHSSELVKETRPITLAAVRPHVQAAGAGGSAFHFCFEDTTTASDSVLLEAYIGKSATPGEIHVDLPVIPLYIRKIAPTKADVLRGNFLIRFVMKGSSGSENSGDTNEGSVQSNDLGPIDQVALFHLRAHVRTMSTNSKKHEFCMADGTALNDNTRLETYIHASSDQKAFESDFPTFTLYFRKVASTPWFGGSSDEMRERVNVDTKVNLKFDEEAIKNPLTGQGIRDRAADTSNMGISEAFIQSLAVTMPAEVTYPSEMDENQWHAVLQNCNVFYGWKFDLSTMSICQAPYAAFKLRDHLNMPVAEIPVPSDTANRSASTAVTSTSRGLEAPMNRSQAVTQPKTDVVAASTSCDNKPQPSSSVLQPPKSSNEDVTTRTQQDPAEAGVAVEAIEGMEETRFSSKPSFQKPNAMPTFRVHDDSRVEVTVVNSRLQESMARNNFTASSFEVGASGNIKGVDLGGSGGKAEKTQEGIAKVQTRTEMTMVGNYRFPRVRLLLRPGDLEPTAELLAAIKDVRRTKSLERLRALHEMFGHLFCGDLLLGGCLQTTRVTNSEDNVTETVKRSQFKAEVGVAVSAPKIGGLNMKHSTEKGEDETQSKQQTKVDDRIVFEATGGNTVLVTTPNEWITSILHHQNWRIIERGNLKPLANVLAECASPQVRDVRKWFVQAVPVLSRYHSVPPTRSLNVRFRVMPRYPAQRELFPDITKSFYLGHQEKRPVHPIRVGVKTLTTEMTESRRERQIQEASGLSVASGAMSGILSFTPVGMLIRGADKLLSSEGSTVMDITQTHVETQTTEEVSMFTPARAQAPVLLQYDDVLQRSFISPALHDESVWEMIVPYDDILKDNTQVMLRSRASTGQKDQDRWLTVYRTFQGTFLPGISSRETASVWRLARDTTMRQEKKDEFYQEGDLVRLTWSFDDQTGGFRDFQLDSFGRRCYQRPLDVEYPTLYFKLPFPGFGVSSRMNSSDTSGLAMCLRGESFQAPYLSPILVNGIGGVRQEGPLKELVYNFHDLSFRLDVIGNDGRGELLDYMTDGLIQETRDEVEKEMKRWTETRTIEGRRGTSPLDDVGRALLGPGYDLISGAAKGIVSGICGIFG